MVGLTGTAQAEDRVPVQSNGALTATSGCWRRRYGLGVWPTEEHQPVSKAEITLDCA